MTLLPANDHSVQTGHLSRLDTLRAFAAFGVVLIHAPPIPHPYDPHSAWQWFVALGVALARVAVPFFFVTSGYLLAHADPDRLRARWSKGARRIVLWMFVYSIAYSLVPVVVALGNGTPSSEAFWFPSQILQDPLSRLVGGVWYHLWFLPQLLIAQAACFLFLRWSRSAWPTGCVAFVVIGLVSLQMHGLLTQDSLIGSLCQSFIHLLYAVGGVTAGAWLARLKKPPSFVILLVAGVLARLVEIARAGNVRTPHDLMEFWAGASTIILALAAVSWGSSPQKAARPLPFVRSFAAVSVGIYLLHPLFLLMLVKIPLLVGQAAPLRSVLGFLTAFLVARLALRFQLTKPLVC